MNPRDKIASNEKITDWRHNSSQKYDTRGDLNTGSGLSINVNAAVGFVSSSQTGSQRTIHPAGEAPKCNPHKSNFTALLSPRQVFDDSRSPRVLVDRGGIVKVIPSNRSAKRKGMYYTIFQAHGSCYQRIVWLISTFFCRHRERDAAATKRKLRTFMTMNPERLLEVFQDLDADK